MKWFARCAGLEYWESKRLRPTPHRCHVLIQICPPDRGFSLQSPPSFSSHRQWAGTLVCDHTRQVPSHRPASTLKAPLGFPARFYGLKVAQKPQFLLLTVISKTRGHDRTLPMGLSCRRGFISQVNLTLTYGCPSRPWQTLRDLLTCFRLNL